MDRLTDKQRKWIDRYKETLNATESARQVYRCSNDKSYAVIGSENLSKLKGYLDTATELSRDITAESVLSRINEIANGGGKARASDRLRALELLGKFKGLGLWREEHSLEVSPAHTYTSEAELDAEYLKILAYGEDNGDKLLNEAGGITYLSGV